MSRPLHPFLLQTNLSFPLWFFGKQKINEPVIISIMMMTDASLLESEMKKLK
jgi:hypothetical protein